MYERTYAEYLVGSLCATVVLLVPKWVEHEANPEIPEKGHCSVKENTLKPGDVKENTLKPGDVKENTITPWRPQASVASMVFSQK